MGTSVIGSTNRCRTFCLGRRQAPPLLPELICHRAARKSAAGLCLETRSSAHPLAFLSSAEREHRDLVLARNLWHFHHLLHQTLLNLALGEGLEDKLLHYHWKVTTLRCWACLGTQSSALPPTALASRHDHAASWRVDARVSACHAGLCTPPTRAPWTQSPASVSTPTRYTRNQSPHHLQHFLLNSSLLNLVLGENLEDRPRSARQSVAGLSFSVKNS